MIYFNNQQTIYLTYNYLLLGFCTKAKGSSSTSYKGACWQRFSDITRIELRQTFFKHDCLYHYHILRINYTTYNICCKQDTINPSTLHRNIMVLVNDEVNGNDPYTYARVIGIYHANVIYTGVQRADYTPYRMQFLWV